MIGNVIFDIFSTACSTSKSINISKFENLFRISYGVQLNDINHNFWWFTVFSSVSIKQKLFILIGFNLQQHQSKYFWKEVPL